ncbi:MAG: hypothetical protein GF384_01830 [Elusimicrobia bacterium]|nr:hypothetical protein [Elusimicrobiota bacterium]MBD3411733.1 hypothetical protein [Elusimicrobiota bacterium]
MRNEPSLSMNAGSFICWYIQRMMDPVFYVFVLLLAAGILSIGNRPVCDEPENGYVFTLCESASFDDDIEVRDAHGRVVHSPVHHRALIRLFASSLFTLAFLSDINTTVQTNKPLLHPFYYGKYMISVPVKAVQWLMVNAIMPSLRKLLVCIRSTFIIPVVTILSALCEGFVILMHSRNLSSIYLRL